MSTAQEENQEQSTALPRPKNAGLGLLHDFYYGVLDRLEWATVTVLLTVVVLVSVIEIISRNTGVHFWDPFAAHKLVYAFTFYLGLFGAVMATRKGKHIAIDVASPYLNPKTKQKIDVLLFLIAAYACVHLAHAAHVFVTESIEPGRPYVESQHGVALWEERLWRWPITPAFGLMAIHFVMGAIERAYIVVNGKQGGQA